MGLGAWSSWAGPACCAAPNAPKHQPPTIVRGYLTGDAEAVKPASVDAAKPADEAAKPACHAVKTAPKPAPHCAKAARKPAACAAKGADQEKACAKAPACRAEKAGCCAQPKPAGACTPKS